MNIAFLGIDIGTSGVRGCCIDKNKRELATASKTIAPPVLENGRSEQDPDLWWQATCDVILDITASLADIEIRSIAIAGTSGTVLLTDACGVPLAAALMYNDQRCTKEAEEIYTLAADDSAAHGTGSGLAKLLHLYRQHPSAEHACHQADWVSSKLTGVFGISDQNNCLKSGYDPVAQDWPDFIQELGMPPELLPQVVTPGTRIGVIQRAIANALGLPPNCEIIAGTTDSIAAFIATGASEIGTGVTSLGSTLSLKMIATSAVFSRDAGIYSHRLGNLWLVGGASNSGGRVLQQFFTPQQINQFTSALDAKKPTGLKYYPLPAIGERFPVNDAELAPCLTPRPADEAVFFQALLEGIATIEKRGYEKLQASSRTPLTKILTSGGGSVNTQWTKIRQNIIGVPITRAEHAEASYGAALLAMSGLR